MLIEAFQSKDVVRERVNSDSDVMALLDEKAELRLRTPFNIFVGGNILDRGITIPHLIAFYYGRNPRTMQADTVLQHSRMYGNRDPRDIAVTRLYTSQRVYDTINEFENTLRDAFESGTHDQGVIFIQTDQTGAVRPCAPNKVLLSKVVAIRPNGLYLPTGFQTRAGQIMRDAQSRIDGLIPRAIRDKQTYAKIDQDVAFQILDACAESLEIADETFEWEAMRGLLKFYASVENDSERDILLLAETGRRLSREKSGDKSGLSILGTALRPKVVDPASFAGAHPAAASWHQRVGLGGPVFLVAHSCRTRHRRALHLRSQGC